MHSNSPHITLAQFFGFAAAFIAALTASRFSGVSSASAAPAPSRSVVHVYDFKATLHVPRVYDNMKSLGYRKYARQVIVGEMLVEYSPESMEPSISFRDLVNKSHKVGGKFVTYPQTEVSAVRWHSIGNNRTGVFNIPSVSFNADLWPDYNVSAAIGSDNSLMLTLAGKGRMTSAICKGAQTPTALAGNAAGTMGCGCADYGHTSPTRVAGPCAATDTVVDIASVWGTWRARLNPSKTGTCK